MAAALAIAVLVGAGAGYFIGVNTSSKSSFGTSFNTTFTTNFHFLISVNYSGSWNLAYWGTNGTTTQSNFTNYNVRGNLTGSGNYATTIVTYGVGYVENTLCAKATKLDSGNHTLTLTILYSTSNTTASNPSAQVCAAYGV